MVNGQWSMVNGQWLMVNGQWSMVNGQWLMVNGQWSMVKLINTLTLIIFSLFIFSLFSIHLLLKGLKLTVIERHIGILRRFFLNFKDNLINPWIIQNNSGHP